MGLYGRPLLALAGFLVPFWYLLTRVDPDIFQTSSETVVCVYCEHAGVDLMGLKSNP